MRKKLLAILFFIILQTPVFSITTEKTYNDVWKLVDKVYIDKSKNSQEWSRWHNKYSKHIVTEDDAIVAINSMLLSLNDPYVRFFNNKNFKEFTDKIGAVNDELGLEVSYIEKKVIINKVTFEKPAYISGIKINDEILKINKKNVKNMTFKEVLYNLASNGKDSTEITIKRGKIIKKLVVHYNNSKISKAETSGSITNMSDNIGYIRISSFLNQEDAEKFKEQLISYQDKDAIILDLRDNRGGFINTALEYADTLMSDKVFTQIISAEGTKKIKKTKNNPLYKKPLVVLINKKTISAAEIFAAALQDNKRAVIVGENSYGKSCIQTFFELSDGTGITITTKKYLTPNSKDISGIGIQPDYIVIQKDNIDEQLEKAKEILLKNNN